VFACGCFWFMEHPFDPLDRVISVTLGTRLSRRHVLRPRVSSRNPVGHGKALQPSALQAW